MSWWKRQTDLDFRFLLRGSGLNNDNGKLEMKVAPYFVCSQDQTLWRQLTCADAEGKLMPSSFRDLMVALIRLSCGSFWNSSAHSTIRAFSFSHTLGWAYTWQATNQLWSLPLCFFLIIEEDRLPYNKVLTHLRARQFEENGYNSICNFKVNKWEGACVFEWCRSRVNKEMTGRCSDKLE